MENRENELIGGLTPEEAEALGWGSTEEGDSEGGDATEA